MPIDARPDHVAIAVRDAAAALPRWRDHLGGVVAWRFHNPSMFRGTVLRYAGGCYLEILEPSDADERDVSLGGPSGFLESFLDRFGPAVHHVTLKVPDLRAAVDAAAAEGLDAVDVDASDPTWQEAFLRPSQIGGLVVQLAATPHTPADQAAAQGTTLPPEPDDGARLLGPRLIHDDLDEASRVWRALGAEVEQRDDQLRVAWDGAPLTVSVVAGPRRAPVGLRLAGTAPRPGDDVLGPAVLASPA